MKKLSDVLRANWIALIPIFWPVFLWFWIEDGLRSLMFRFAEHSEFRLHFVEKIRLHALRRKLLPLANAPVDPFGPHASLEKREVREWRVKGRDQNRRRLEEVEMKLGKSRWWRWEKTSPAGIFSTSVRGQASNPESLRMSQAHCQPKRLSPP